METSSNNSNYEKRVQKAQNQYNKRIDINSRLMERRRSFVEKSDRIRKTAIKKSDERLQKRRVSRDERLLKNREKIEKKYINNNPEKKERFENAKKRTDNIIRILRKRHDAKRRERRRRIERRKAAFDRRIEILYEENRIKEANRLEKIKEDRENEISRRKMRIMVLVGSFFLVMIAILELMIPGSEWRRSKLSNSGKLEEKIEKVVEKQYKKYGKKSEMKIIWNELDKHFSGNRNAIIGIMCNLKSESDFRAMELENYNNQIWKIDDDEYTEKINEKEISKKDFLEARHLGITNGYLGKYNEWVNRDGGYGYGQYTSYGKKKSLYKFAKRWFEPGGKGENYKFNIADPQMQAEYIVYLLESEEYKELDARLRTAGSVVDACYLWLKKYEIPADPYNDNYYTLAFKRSESARQIELKCGN